MKHTTLVYTVSRYFCAAIVLVALILGSCNGNAGDSQSSDSRDSREAARQKKAALQVEAATERRYRERSLRIARSLAPEALAAQVLMSGVEGKEEPSPDMKELLSEIPLGALMLFKYNIADSPRSVHAFIAQCTAATALAVPAGEAAPQGSQSRIEESGNPSASPASSLSFNPVPIESPMSGPTALPGRIYPFVAIDHEGGDVSRLGQVATRLPPPERYLQVLMDEASGPSADSGGIPESAWLAIRQAAYLSGRELRTLGITMNLAPVAEVLSPENRSFLQNRGFAADPAAAASAAAAFIQGMGEAGVTSVVKHFPASAAADPHYGLSVLDTDRKGLEYLAAPFEALLGQRGPQMDRDRLYPPSLYSLPVRPGAVMVAHTIVPAIEPDLAASLSSRFMQDWIKNRLGFQGIVLADDFTMKAIASRGITPEAALVQAILAGADMVMVWPRDLRRFHRLLVERAKSDTLFQTRLIDAASRIIYQKLLWGLVESSPAQAAEFNEEGYGCMRKATEQFLRERNLR